MDIEIKPIDFRTATREEWTIYHVFRKKHHDEEYSGDPIFDDEQEEIWIQSIYDEFEVFFFFVTRRDNPNEFIAILRMRYVSDDAPSYPGNEHIMRTLLYVLIDHRRQGIGLELIKRVTEYCREHKKSSIMIGTSQEDGRKALQKLGATEAFNTRDNRTNLDDIDWAMIERWEKEGPRRSPDSKIEFFVGIPDEILEDYCKVYTEVFNQVLIDELDIGQTVWTPELWKKNEQRNKEIGITWLTGIIREKNGDIAGLTDVYYEPAHAPLLYQGLTGVQEKYRGSGKGKWLKAAMLLRIREEYPDIKTITTQTETSNAPMLAINERLGFKIHKELYTCQVETEKVVDYLKNKR